MPLFKRKSVKVEFSAEALAALEAAADRVHMTIEEFVADAALVAAAGGKSALALYSAQNEALANPESFSAREQVAQAVIDSNLAVAEALNRQTQLGIGTNPRSPAAAMVAWQQAQEDLDDTIKTNPDGFGGLASGLLANGESIASRRPQLSAPQRLLDRKLLGGKK